MDTYQFVIIPPPTPDATSADDVATAFREYYADAIATTWAQHFHPVQWKIFNAFLMSSLILERAGCEWDEATDACIKHFPELFADYWMSLPFDPDETLAESLEKKQDKNAPKMKRRKDNALSGK